MRLGLALQLFCSLVLTAEAVAQDSTAKVGRAMTEAATHFVEKLTPMQRALAIRTFDDPSRLAWHNIPKPERKGLQFRDMSPETQASCLQLLKVALSEKGFAKARRIMALESNLREGEKNLSGGAIRDPQRYFLTIFGQPAMAGQWGWSFEGHHLSMNFVVREGEVASETPSFWGANPATVRLFVEGGPEQGTRTLAEEEQLGFDLVQSLDNDQLQHALINPKAPEEYRGAGEPQPPNTPAAGIHADKLTTTQQANLRGLVETYCRHWADPIAAARLAEIDAAGWENLAFAWAGSIQAGVGHYYCVQGPSFVLELINVQSDPAGNVANHVHSVWRNLHGDFDVAIPVANTLNP